MGALSLLSGYFAHATAPGPVVEGTVRTARGAPVAGATVRCPAPGPFARTAADGRFRLELAVAGACPGVTVEAPGFAAAERTVSGGAPLDVVLQPAGPRESVIVTPARGGSDALAAAANVSVRDRERFASSPALAVDDRLRDVPGFTLLRRTGSRAANPTAQGVSLRGIGSNGASRAALLDDGVPLADPLGGWAYWDRIAPTAIDRVEVLRGGASDLYGSGALSGVVQFLRRMPQPGLRADLSAGAERTRDGSLSLGTRTGAWGAGLDAAAFRSDGYLLVRPPDAGPVDRAAATRHSSVELTGDHVAGETRVFARASVFDETRNNGTLLQENGTHLRQGAAGFDGPALGGSVSARAYALHQDYEQTFSSITNARSRETLTLRQTTPSRAWGGSAQWTRGLGAVSVTGGIEGRSVHADSDEQSFGAQPSLLEWTATQRQLALFAEGVLAAGARTTVALSVRGDDVRTGDASRTVTPLSGTATHTDLPDRSEGALSPRLVVVRRVGGAWSLSAAAYRAFRAPTLNELYRSFQVGSIVTEANDALRAERLAGGEAGATWSAHGVHAAATVFWNEVERPVVNVTIGTNRRRRENLGRLRSRGVELEADARLAAHWRVSGSLALYESTVRRFEADPTLVGLDVPQVPRRQGTLELRWDDPRWASVTLRGRWVGRQYDDDRNALPLGGYATFDARVEKGLGRGVALFAAGENLLDREVVVGRTPVASWGAPRLVRAGIRVAL